MQYTWCWRVKLKTISLHSRPSSGPSQPCSLLLGFLGLQSRSLWLLRALPKIVADRLVRTLASHSRSFALTMLQLKWRRALRRCGLYAVIYPLPGIEQTFQQQHHVYVQHEYSSNSSITLRHKCCMHMIWSDRIGSDLRYCGCVILYQGLNVRTATAWFRWQWQTWHAKLHVIVHTFRSLAVHSSAHKLMIWLTDCMACRICRHWQEHVTHVVFVMLWCNKA